MNNDHANIDRARPHDGSCHCGAVRFRARLDLGRGATRCNCSICTKLGVTAMIVKPAAFALVAGAASLGSYQCGAKISSRHFCKACGVYLFARGHLAEVGGDFVSVNVNCLDDVDVDQLPIAYWDGRHDNWDAGPSPAPWPRFRTAVAWDAGGFAAGVPSRGDWDPSRVPESTDRLVSLGGPDA